LSISAANPAALLAFPAGAASIVSLSISLLSGACSFRRWAIVAEGPATASGGLSDTGPPSWSALPLLSAITPATPMPIPKSIEKSPTRNSR
jgi:hypothetical protein